jgi:uncharacterized protein YxeA
MVVLSVVLVVLCAVYFYKKDTKKRISVYVTQDEEEKE